MSNFSLLCSWLTVKFLSFGYSCNIHGFWYFARLQSCKIQVNPQNPTKFTNTHSKMPQNLAEILSNTCLYNIFETYVSYWGYCDRLSPLSIWSLWSLWSLCSLRKRSSAIIWKPFSSDRSDNNRWDRTFYFSAIIVAAIAGEWFHMIAMIDAIAEVFFFFFAIAAMVAIIWKPGFNLIMAYFKCKDCLQRNLCIIMKKPWRLVITYGPPQ